MHDIDENELCYTYLEGVGFKASVDMNLEHDPVPCVGCNCPFDPVHRDRRSG